MIDRIIQLWRRVFYYLRRDKFDRELEEEMRFHLEMQAEENLRTGMNEKEARFAAQRQFGNQTLLREVSREMWSYRSIEIIFQDIRYGIRMLRKHPGFTLTVVLTLALGIGANTAIFSVINAVLLRPLPYRDSEGLVLIQGIRKQQSEPQQVSMDDFQDWKDQAKSFERLALFRGRSRNLTGGDEPERIIAAMITADLLPLLDVKPLLGRNFLAEEDKPGANKTVILSHSLWQRRFGERSEAIGQTITLDSESYTVIGIMAPDFWFFALPEAELWVPLGLTPIAGRDSRAMNALARLKPDIALSKAQAEMESITSRLELEYPNSNTGWGAKLVPVQDSITGEIRPALQVMWIAVGFVLLIACANVANLLISRTISLRQEIAVRLSLGASRSRVIRQILTENLVLSIVSGCVGLILAAWGVELLTALNPGNIPRFREVSLDARVVLFTAVVSILTSIMVSLLPAWEASKTNLSDALKEGRKGSGSSAGQLRTLRLLVVSEVALALVLLISAGLLIASFQNLVRVDPGFQADNLLTLQMIPRANYPKLEQQTAFIKEVLERLRALAGVEDVAEVNFLPLSGNDSRVTFTIVGRTTAETGVQPEAHFRAISPGYFRIMQIPLLQGRDLTEADFDEPQAVIINTTMANRFWSGEEALGQRIRYQGWELVIVGIIGDVKHSRLDADPVEEMYLPYSFDPFSSIRTLIIKGEGNVANLAHAARSEILAVNKNQTVFNIRTMDQVLAESVVQPRFNMWVLGTFALVALILAAVGIYGVMAWSVTQRTHEIGIRMALGAQRGDVLRMVISEGMNLVLIGVTIGLLSSFALTSLMKKLLFGISNTDPLLFSVITIVLMLTALLACWIPARRATKADPMVALRYE